MANESLYIEIDGEEATDLYDDLVGLEVELSDEHPSSFRLCVSLAKHPDDGTWEYQDEERFRIWKPIMISVGFVDSGPEEVLRGFITRVEPHFSEDEGQSVLEVTGMDSSVVMDREEKLRPWPNMKDSDVATAILGDYPFTPDVKGTDIVHDQAVSTVIQRETDLQFLKRLALRNGFVFYVEEDVAHFEPAPTGKPLQPLLAAHFGGETSLTCFRATVDALRPSRVRMVQVDRLSKEVLTAEADSPREEPLGATDAASLETAGVEGTPMVHVGNNAVTGQPEMEALCQRLFDEGASFVNGEGEIDSAAYAHVLKPRGFVTVKGVGESYSGVYYVSFVRHTVTREGYTQFFRARRDALEPRGDEQFESNGGPGGLL